MLEPKFGQIIHKTKSTYYNTATPRLHGARAKILSYYTQDKPYTLQHSYSKAPWSKSQNLVKLYTRQSLTTTTQLLQGSMELEPKFGQIIHKTSLHSTTQLLQGSMELEPKFGQIIHKTMSTYYNTATPRLHGARAKILSYYTQDKPYTLQHSYSKAPWS